MARWRIISGCLMGSLMAMPLLLACGHKGVLEPSPGQEILGEWQTDKSWFDCGGATIIKEDAGYFTWSLRFATNGEYISKTTSFGGCDKSPDKLSYWSETYGSFTIEGDTLMTQPKLRRWWDSFYGESRPREEQLNPDDRVFDDVRFTVAGNALTLTYYSYPADAPVLTQQTYYRLKQSIKHR